MKKPYYKKVLEERSKRDTAERDTAKLNEGNYSRSKAKREQERREREINKAKKELEEFHEGKNEVPGGTGIINKPGKKTVV